MSELELNPNMYEHSKTTPFKDDGKPTEDITAIEEDWCDEGEFKIASCSFIQLAVKEDDLLNIEDARKEFQRSMQLAADDKEIISYSNFTELENGTKVCRLDNDSWLVKAPKKIVVKTIYSGLYI